MLHRDSHPDRLCHLAPTRVLLTFEAAQIGGGDRQGGVIQEPGHILDALACVPAELGRSVPEDMKPGRRQPGFLQIPAKPAVKGGAAEPFVVGGGRRGLKRFAGGHVLQVALPGRQRGSQRV